MELSAKQIASYVQGDVVGNEDAKVHIFAKIEDGFSGALSFLANPKYTHYLYTTQSTIVLVNRDFEPEQPVKATLIKVDNAYDSLAKLMTLYEQSKPKKQGIDPLASVAASAQVGDGVYIGAFAVVGEDAVIGAGTQLYPHSYVGDSVKVGEHCILYSNVNIYHDCRIGNGCILHSGAVIGADGFGFAPTAEGYEKIPQIGIVVLEDEVEVGANTCIDRATMGATIIHKGVKLDNLIQIAHNDEIGSNTVIAAQTAVAGSTKVGEWNMIGGQVGLGGHIKIGDKVLIAAQSGIASNVKSGSRLLGSPAFDIKASSKSAVIFKRLPEMYEELTALRKEIEALKTIIKE
jgi:UDP-3-O-[3-hydroxymyristoyl] glucosamine N-acyltransferase